MLKQKPKPSVISEYVRNGTRWQKVKSRKRRWEWGWEGTSNQPGGGGAPGGQEGGKRDERKSRENRCEATRKSGEITRDEVGSEEG